MGVGVGKRGRVRVQLGHSKVECGAACLAMIVSCFGRHTSVQEIRDHLSLGRDGATAAALAGVARKLGLDVRPARVEPPAFRSLTLPALAHWNFNHFVVVESWSERGAVIVDPAVGRRHVAAAEFNRSFTGIVLEFAPTEQFLRRPRPRLAFLSFVRPFVPRLPGAIGLVLLCSVLLTLLGLLPAALTKYLVDAVIPRADQQILLVLGAGVAAFAVGQALVVFGRAELLLYLQTRVDASMMSRFLKHLFSLPYAYFQLRAGGDLLMRVSSNLAIRDLLTVQSIGLFLDGGLIVCYLAVLFGSSTGYGVLIAFLGVVQLLFMALFRRRTQELTQRELGKVSESQSYLLETLVGIESIKASGAEDRVYQRWGRLFDQQLKASMASKSLENWMDLVLTFFSTATPLALLWFGAQQVTSGAMSMGTMLALNSIASAALAPVSTLAGRAKQLQTAGVHLARLQDVFCERGEQEPGEDRRTLALRGDVRLERVTFRYSGDSPPAVRDISLACPAGARVAIVGRTGSGKSTLAKLLLGLYRPTDGTVRFDGVQLEDIDIYGLRRQCGVVMQEPHIFSGSILSNITLNLPEAGLDDAARAARLAEIHDEIAAMPMGYETVLAEGGAGLSGGQRQRLAIARALLGNPRILLFDEATSHLDAVTEQAVQRNLDELACTRIVIAHRLSTVRDADLVVVMEDGRIVQTGTHDELVAVDGRYNDLVLSQLS